VKFYCVENLLFLQNFIKNLLPSETNFKGYLKNLLEVKVKVNFALEQSIKDQRGSRGIVVLLL